MNSSEFRIVSEHGNNGKSFFEMIINPIPNYSDTSYGHTDFDQILSENDNQNGAINDILNSQHTEDIVVVRVRTIFSQNNKTHDVYHYDADPE